MKKVLLDFNELTDSKEYYSSRPNPAVAIFIYCILILLAVALAYSFFGSIEIVASATGTILPNDQIGSVSSLVGGRIIEIVFRDGQTVEEGDILFTVDNTELLLSLDYLQESQTEAQFQSEMQEKYILSLQEGENLFSDDTASEEYPYYVQYEYFALSLLDSENNMIYEEDTVRENINALNKQLTNLNRQLDGQKRLKESIESSSNQVSQYPEYENQFFLYEAIVEGMKQEFESKRQSLVADTSELSRTTTLAHYQEQIQGYSKLVNSIKDGKSAFDQNDNSIYKGLYEDYLFQLEQYQATYNKASETQSFLRDNSGNDYSPMLQYQRTMLEGYTFFRQSVNDNRDVFNPGSASYAYRSLYMEYKYQHDILHAVYENALQEYEYLVENEGGEEEISAAADAMRGALAIRDEYIQSTLATINNQILQINSNMEEINLNTGTNALEHQLSLANFDTASAKESVDAYKNRMQVEYIDTLLQLSAKEQELQYTQDGTIPKEKLIADLDNYYQQGLWEKKITAITQIESALLSLENQLNTAEASLSLNRLAQAMYAANRSKNSAEKDILIPISYMRLKALTEALSTKEALKNRIMDLDSSIEQTQQKIDTATTKASRAGIINRVRDIGLGDIVGVGDMIATIVPSDETAYKVQLYVSNKDIAGIEVGATIKYNVMALPSRQYGTIDGTVTYIGTDTLIQNNQRSGYYLVEGTIYADALTDKDGNQATIATGMQVEGKIVTQKKSIIRYLLEKINLS